MRTTFVNGRVLLPEGFRDGSAVAIEDDHIVEIGGMPSGKIVDLEGRMLVPGFVDIQVNGGGDVMLNDRPDATALRWIADAHLRYGGLQSQPGNAWSQVQQRHIVCCRPNAIW